MANTKEKYENRNHKPERIHKQENSFRSAPKNEYGKETITIMERSYIVEIIMSRQMRIPPPPPYISQSVKD